MTTDKTRSEHLPESRFLHIRALTEDNVRGTRLAAMATIFNITEHEAGTRMLLKAPSGLERLLPCLGSTYPPESDKPDADMRVRTAGTIVNLIQNGGEGAIAKLKKLNAEKKLRTAKDEDVSGQVAGFVDEALELLLKA